CITSGTAPHNDQVVHRSQFLLNEILCPTDRILDIVDAPLTAQRLHVGFTVACAATMVDLQDGVAAGGKKLCLRVKAGHCLGGRAPVDVDDRRWWSYPLKTATARGIEQPVDQVSSDRMPGEGLRCREF